MATQTSPIINTKGLVKEFGSFKALNKLDLTVLPGEVHGFLGPNGAGKSTTIRILLGLLKATDGSATLFGQDPWNDSVQLHRRLAYVPGDVNLWPNLSGGEVIDLLGALRGGLVGHRREELLERFKLDPTKKCSAYSKGNRQKVVIVAALASDVELYIMDEPTSGLDPLMQDVFNQEVLRLKEAGKTVLLSSHVLGEVDELCDRVTLIKEGRTVESNSLSNLRKLAHMAVTVETKKPMTRLGLVKGVHVVSHQGPQAVLSVEPASMEMLMRHLLPFGIVSFVSSPPTLEELFLRHYGDAGVR